MSTTPFSTCSGRFAEKGGRDAGRRALAVVLVRGRASLAEFEDDVVKDPAVLALAFRVGYDLDPTIDYPRQFIGHVRARLRDGRVVEESQDHPRGGPDAPMSRDEIEAKFRGNASLVMSDDQATRVIRTLDARSPRSTVSSISWNCSAAEE